MATTLYLTWLSAAPTASCISTLTGWDGLSVSDWPWWGQYALGTSRGSGVASGNSIIGTPAGPTNGLEFGWDGWSPNLAVWKSPPLAADVTISGTISCNFWGYESSMSANATMNGRVLRLNGQTNEVTEIGLGGSSTELGTSSSARSFDITPTSTDFKRGDRIMVTPYVDDAGTLGDGYNVSNRHNGATPGADGDAYVTFTETITFESDPSGTYIYPTATAAGINPGSATEKEMWTSRGGGSTSAVTLMGGGTAATTEPVPFTATAGGSTLEWYTKTMAATTLEGAVAVQVRALQNQAVTMSGTIIRGEIAICDADGSNPVVWAQGGNYVHVSTTAQDSYTFWLAGPSTAISNGQRIRLRLFLWHAAYGGDRSYAMAGDMSTDTITGYYAGSSGGSGDTWLRFSSGVTFTEYASVDTVTGDFTVDATLSIHQQFGFTISAWMVSHVTPTPFTVDASIYGTVTPDPFTVDAFLVSLGYGYFEISAIKLETFTPTPFTVDAFIGLPHIPGDFTLDALVNVHTEDDFTVDAEVGDKHISDDFTLDAIIRTHVLNGIDRVAFSQAANHKPPTFDSVGNGAADYADVLTGTGGTTRFGHRTTGQWYAPPVPPATIGSYYNHETFWAWPVFVLRSGETVLGAELAMAGYVDHSEVDVVLEAYAAPWVGLFWTEQYRSQTELAALPIVATLNTANYSTSLMTFTDVDLDSYLSTTDNPSATGHTELVIASQEYRLGSAPSTSSGSDEEYITFRYYGDGAPLPVIYVTVSGGTPFTVDAWITEGSGKVYASFQVYALLNATSPDWDFTLDAEIRAIARSGDFTVDASLFRHWDKTFTLDAEIYFHYFLVNAQIVLPTQWDVFVVSAIISRNLFTLDAEIGPGGQITLDAVINRPYPLSFTVDAWVRTASSAERSFPVDAVLRSPVLGVFFMNAELGYVITGSTWSAPVDAVVLETLASSLAVDAEIHASLREGGFTLDAELRSQAEKRGSFTVDAVILQGLIGVFVVGAELAHHIFRVDAYIARWFTVNAEIYRPCHFTLDAYIRKAPFTLDAVIRGPVSGQAFTLDAMVADAGGAFPDHEGTFTVDAVVLSVPPVPVLYLDAVIAGPPSSHSFTLDAWFGGGFTLDAFIQPYFTIDAHILGNDYILWPDDGGPAEDPNGVPLPPWYKANRKYRVNITLDGTDVTADVIWSQSSFTQNAKTNPGNFELVLKGVHAWDGGEEIIVSLDDFRQFGGYVLSVEKSYVFDADAGDAITTLRGTDYNVLFDKLIVYNRASTNDGKGSYRNWKNFAKGTLDSVIIEKVFSDYVDLPTGFEYSMFVDTVGVAAPEKPWAMPTPGSPLRQVMQSLSQVTNAVWWIDPYLHLHYGSRTTVTAPYPITDGLGGVSSQNIRISEDMSRLVTETILWGTLAYTVEGDVVASRKTSDSYGDFGPWQYGEFRDDLHHEAFIDRRTDSIIERYGQPIKKAKLALFDPGYQAGQVADVRLTGHGITEILPIRSLALVFAASKGPSDGYYYAVPRYELEIGLDPEDPWDIYDYLPFPDNPGTPYKPTRVRVDENDEHLIDDFSRLIPAASYSLISTASTAPSGSYFKWLTYIYDHEIFGTTVPYPANIPSTKTDYPEEVPLLGYSISEDSWWRGQHWFNSIAAHLQSLPVGTSRVEITQKVYCDQASTFLVKRYDWGTDTLTNDWDDLECVRTDSGDVQGILTVPYTDFYDAPDAWDDMNDVFVTWTVDLLPGQVSSRYCQFGTMMLDPTTMKSEDKHLVLGHWTQDPYPPDNSGLQMTIKYYGKSLAPGYTTIYTGTWGDTSETGDRWLDTNNPAASVWADGNVGRVQLRSPYYEASSRELLTLNEGGSRWNPSSTGTEFPDELVTGSSVQFQIDIMCDNWDPLAETTAVIGLYDNLETSIGGVEVYLKSGPDGVVRLASTTPADTDDVAMTLESSTWYTVKVWLTGSNAFFKIWSRDSDPEPLGWMADVTITPLPWTPGEFSIYLETASTARDSTGFQVDNFKRLGGGALSVDDIEGETYGAVGEGWNWETRIVENEQFATTARVTKGTLVVFDANGSFLLPGDEWDYADGTGQLFDVFVPTAKVTVGYRAWIVNVRSLYSTPRDVDPSRPNMGTNKHIPF